MLDLYLEASPGHCRWEHKDWWTTWDSTYSRQTWLPGKCITQSRKKEWGLRWNKKERKPLRGGILTVTYTFLFKWFAFLCMQSRDSGTHTMDQISYLHECKLFSFLLLACLNFGSYLLTEQMSLNGNRLWLLCLYFQLRVSTRSKKD